MRLMLPLLFALTLISPAAMAGAAADLSRLEAFAAAIPAGEWRELPASSIESVLVHRQQAPNDGGVTGPISVIYAWNGAAFDGQRWYFHGGGHADYSGNEVYAFDFSTLTWSRLTQPSRLKPRTVAQPCPDTVDGTPLASHTYDGFLYVPTTGTIWLWPGVEYCASGMRYRTEVWEFDPKKRSWKMHPRDPLPGFMLSAFDPKTGDVVLFAKGTALWFDPRKDAYFGQSLNAGDVGEGTAAIDPETRDFWALTRFALLRSHMGDAAMGPIRMVARAADLPAGLTFGAGVVFDSKRHRLVFWGGGRTVWTYAPDTGKWAAFPNPAGPAPLAGTSAIYSKWLYLPDADVFAGYANVTQGVWLYKPADEPQAMAPPTTGVKRVCPNDNFDANCDYSELCTALKAARDGDRIVMRPGVYREGCALTANRITLEARGAHLTGVAYDGKANLVVQGNDTTIDGLECSRAYAAGNGACLRIEGRNILLRHMHIHDEQMGILSGGPNGKIVIEDSVIENIGMPNSDLSHGIYISENKRGVADEFDIRRSIVRTSRYEGHLIKSRAMRTVIEQNVLASLDGQNSREIDIPQGGIAIIRDNVIEKGPKSENWDMIGLALEPQFGIRQQNETIIEGNWLIFDRPDGRILTNRSPGRVRMADNRIVGLGPSTLVDKIEAGNVIGRGVEERADRYFSTREEAGLAGYPALPSPGRFSN